MSIIERLVDFMLWDGVAIVIFAGIIMLGIRAWRPRLGLLVALCIPVANLVIVGLNVHGFSNVQPFLQMWVVVVMFFCAVLVMIPWFESPV
jgi:hypothetical protein